MCSGIIPEGTYELKVGESFLLGSSGGKGGRAPEFNTLRFDFKPASISSGSEAYIAESQNENDFQVIVPGGGEGQRPTIFKGAKKAIKGDKECLLVYDERTKELRLERVSANIFVKKTRDTELDANVRGQIERLEKKKGKAKKVAVEQPAEKQQQQREQAVQPQKAEKEDKGRGEQQQKREKTVSMSSAGEEESGEYDDENVSALEQLMGGPSPITSASPKMASPPPPAPKKNGGEPSSAKKQPSPVKKSSSFVKKSILAEDLQLSESSSSSEDGEEDEE